MMERAEKDLEGYANHASGSTCSSEFFSMNEIDRATEGLPILYPSTRPELHMSTLN